MERIEYRFTKNIHFLSFFSRDFDLIRVTSSVRTLIMKAPAIVGVI
ncbi:hypothetical protein HMPREF0880_02872 [Yokenella regensburgei ATCC 43003]|nr:hypothetical protein HMPREF0880_02872 [Yokenella regensburgei ATCC 43003]